MFFFNKTYTFIDISLKFHAVRVSVRVNQNTNFFLISEVESAVCIIISHTFLRQQNGTKSVLFHSGNLPLLCVSFFTGHPVQFCRLLNTKLNIFKDLLSVSNSSLPFLKLL